ncbi:MAG: murein biosynthesis integral membrane protein MurJ [Actinomycetota bacterium]
MSTNLARSTAIMTVGTVLSRATGLLRIAAIAAALGVVETGGLSDAFNYANTAPNIIYELFLGGVLTSVFVPVFVELLEKEGRERAWQVASALINVAVVGLVAVSIVGILLSPWIAKLYTLNVDGDTARMEEVMTFLLRLFIPQIIFYALTAITAGLLNSHKRFGPPMFTPVLNNLAVIAVFLSFRYAVGSVTLESVTTGQLIIIGGGTTFGVVLMALAQLPFLRGLGRYRWTFHIRHPSVIKLAKLSVFVIGYVVTNQLGYLVVQVLAGGEVGGYTAYTWAFTFFLLPHGLFAVSIMTALLPGMSEHATNERWDLYRGQLSVGVRATTLLILPAAVGYFVLGTPIVRVLLEHGVMGPESTELVASVLRFFVLGLVPFAVYQLFLRAFYALHDTKTPFYINLGVVALNTALNIPMYALFGVRGLAAGHAIHYFAGVILQGRILSRRVEGIDERRIARSSVRIGLASLGMGVLVWGVYSTTSALIDPTSFVNDLLIVLLPVAAGALAFLGLCVALRIEELDYAKAVVGRRFAAKG